MSKIGRPRSAENFLHEFEGDIVVGGRGFICKLCGSHLRRDYDTVASHCASYKHRLAKRQQTAIREERLGNIEQ